MNGSGIGFRSLERWIVAYSELTLIATAEFSKLGG